MQRVDQLQTEVIGIFPAVTGPYLILVGTPLLTLLRRGRDFAANIGIQFHTPEEFFLKEAPKSFTRDFDPAAYCNKPGLLAANQSKTCSKSPIVLGQTGLALREY
jgi:hypothetical protein